MGWFACCPGCEVAGLGDGVEHRVDAHGLLYLALTDEADNLIWISSALRGAASEITSARHDKLCEHLRTAGLGALADLGFVGLDQDPDDPVIITGVERTRKKKLTAAQKHANQLIAATRASVEHDFAALRTGASSPGCG